MYHWLVFTIFNIALLCTILLLISIAFAAFVDVVVLENKTVFHGLGYAVVFVGAAAAVAGGMGLHNYPARLVTSSYVLFYRLGFEPSHNAINTTPRQYSVPVWLAGFIVFLYGLVLLGY